MPPPFANAPAATDLDLISYRRSIPDARMRRGLRFHAWFLLLVAVLGTYCFVGTPEKARSTAAQLVSATQAR
jgi:hypothetical protein